LSFEDIMVIAPLLGERVVWLVSWHQGCSWVPKDKRVAKHFERMLFVAHYRGVETLSAKDGKLFAVEL
jgi:hypothetical protein